MFLHKNLRNICVAICFGFTQKITSLPGIFKADVKRKEKKNIVNTYVNIKSLAESCSGIAERCKNVNGTIVFFLTARK